MVLREVADLDLVAPLDGAGVDGDVLLFDARAVGEQGLEQRGLAQPLRPMRTILSPRMTAAEKLLMTCSVLPSSAVGLVDGFELEDVLAGGPHHLEGDEGARDVGAREFGGCRRSTSFLREFTCEERVPAENRAMKSLSWAIFFSRCSFWLSMRERIWSWPPPCRRSRRCR